jgi:hypothetical protein
VRFASLLGRCETVTLYKRAVCAAAVDDVPPPAICLVEIDQSVCLGYRHLLEADAGTKGTVAAEREGGSGGRDDGEALGGGKAVAGLDDEVEGVVWFGGGGLWGILEAPPLWRGRVIVGHGESHG